MQKLFSLFVVLSFVTAFYTIARAATPTVSCTSTTKSFSLDATITAISDLVRPSEPFKLVVTSPPSTGTVTWMIDGATVPGQGNSLCYAFAQAGTKKIQIQTPSTSQTQTVALTVASYPNITIDKLLPNPVGSDTKEEIVLKNGNDFTVNLQNWKLQSKTTKTDVPITVTIAPTSAATINSSSKLKNDGGTYDLVNESGSIVDSITYTTPQAGQYVTKNGPVGGSSGSSSSSAGTSSSSPSTTPTPDVKVTITGTVTKPSGDTIDIRSDDGQNVHVVINASFDGVKPKLHQDDRITVTGIWKKSSAGTYLSVRQGDTVTLINGPTNSKSDSKAASAVEAAPKSAVVSVGTNAPHQTDAGQAVLADSATASNGSTSSLPPANHPPTVLTTPQNASSLPLSQPLRWLFITMITLGTGLALPFHRGKSV